MRLAILTKDLLISVRLEEALHRAGHDILAASLSGEADVALVDLGPTGLPDPPATIQRLRAGGVKVIAFGPHAQGAALARAREEGAEVVVSNGQALSDPVGLIARVEGHGEG